MSCCDQNCIQEDYCSNDRFVDLKDTWTRNGSTQKTLWLPYGKRIINNSDIKEEYCSNCNGYSYSPNKFTGTSISNVSPKNQPWKQVLLTDTLNTLNNPMPMVGIESKKLIDNPHIYNIDSRYNTSRSVNSMRYPMSYSPHSNIPYHNTARYKELSNINCGI